MLLLPNQRLKQFLNVGKENTMTIKGGDYKKREMDRREFFRRSFAAGIVAAVPYSIFSLDKWGKTVENVVEKKFDFSQFQSFLIRNGSMVIAKSNHTTVTAKRELIGIYTEPYGWREYIPGPWNFNVSMGRVYEIAHLSNIREVLYSSEELIVFFKAMNGDLYEGNCQVTNLEYVSGSNLEQYLNIDLIGIGTLIRK
jgi:hypothetical protein